MKILMLFPEEYSLKDTIKRALESLGNDVLNINYKNLFKDWQNVIIKKTNGLPRKMKNWYHESYRDKINRKYLEIIQNERPELVIVYNDQYLDLKTARKIKTITKLVFYLGDNPFFMHNKPYDNLGIFLEGNFIISPDSYWTFYFKKIGFKKIENIHIGYDPKINYKIIPTKSQIEKYSNDLVMIGRMYPYILSQWSYKRALFYDQFTDLDIKIYGHKWESWFELFPSLREKTIILKKYLSFDEVNTILNCCKIYPIDANPGMINGIHIRVFDCIGSGIMPLVEYQKDLEKIFQDVELPMIKNYSEAGSIAKQYLKNDEKRERINRELREYIDYYYTPQKAVKKILNFVFND